MYIRRDRKASTRFVGLRVGLYFLAAGLWFGGVGVENDTITAIAMGVAVFAILFSLGVRRWAEGEDHDDNGSPA